MSANRLSGDNNPIFIFHPTVVGILTKDLVNKINNSWKAFAQLETSKHLAVDLKEHFNELKQMIGDINTASSKDQCAESLETLYEKIKSMAQQHQFIVKEEVEALSRMGAQSAITNVVIDLFEGITELKSQLLIKTQEASSVEKEEKPVISSSAITVSCDEKESIRLFQLAANQKRYAQARTNYKLGEMYENGYGVHHDDEKAVRFYRLAIDQGYAPAMYEMARWCEYGGHGVSRDDKEAIRLFNLAIQDFPYREAKYSEKNNYTDAGYWNSIDSPWYHLGEICANNKHYLIEQVCLKYKNYSPTNSPYRPYVLAALHAAFDGGKMNRLKKVFTHRGSDEFTYHAAIVLKESKMKKAFISLAKNKPKKIAALFDKSQDSWVEMQQLLTPEVAVKVYESTQAIAAKKLSLIEKVTPLYSAISEMVLKYLTGESFTSHEAFLIKKLISDRKLKNQLKPFFTHKKFTQKDLATRLGLDYSDSFYEKDMKQIQSYFFSEPVSKLRFKQGELLKSIYNQMKNVYDKIKKLTDPHQISDLLCILSNNLAEVQLQLASDIEDRSNKDINEWLTKIFSLQIHIDDAIEYIRKHPSQEEERTTRLSIK